MHRRGQLTVGPQSALEAVVAVHDLLRAEGRPTDPEAATRAEIDATVLRAVELRDLIRAGLWPG